MKELMGDPIPRNERLRQHRCHRNWRQSDVAEQLGTTVTTIQRWERGIQQPSVYYRARLCTLFGLSALELGFIEPTIPSPLPESNTSDAGSASIAPSEEMAIWTVPYARNPHFTGRGDLLARLEHCLVPVGASQMGSVHQSSLPHVQALTGLGGMGKTQIAVEYAYRARERGHYIHTFWIRATSEEELLASLVAQAGFLPVLQSSPKTETDQRTFVAEVICWLEQCEQPWLLIFDNADDLSLVQAYRPRRGNGSILLTTRTSAVGSLASSIEVEAMGLLEGTRLLLRRAQYLAYASSEEINEASNIVVALAQFPLAIDQAGAYIEETQCSFRDYLQLYKSHRHALLARRGRQTSGYPESVVTTWSPSFEELERVNPAAAELLRLCAFLASDHIPEELFIQGAPYWPPLLQQAVSNRLTFNQMLEDLLRFSLVKRLSEHHLLSVHHLVQVIQRERMELQERVQWVTRLVCAVNVLFPRDLREDMTRGSLCLRYLEQVQMCVMLIQRYHLQIQEAVELQDRIGRYLSERAFYNFAEPLSRASFRV